MKQVKQRREWGHGKNALQKAKMPWPVTAVVTVSIVLPVIVTVSDIEDIALVVEFII